MSWTVAIKSYQIWALPTSCEQRCMAHSCGKHKRKSKLDKDRRFPLQILMACLARCLACGYPHPRVRHQEENKKISNGGWFQPEKTTWISIGFIIWIRMESQKNWPPTSQTKFTKSVWILSCGLTWNSQCILHIPKAGLASPSVYFIFWVSVCLQSANS